MLWVARTSDLAFYKLCLWRFYWNLWVVYGRFFFIISLLYISMLSTMAFQTFSVILQLLNRSHPITISHGRHRVWIVSLSSFVTFVEQVLLCEAFCPSVLRILSLLFSMIPLGISLPPSLIFSLSDVINYLDSNENCFYLECENTVSGLQVDRNHDILDGTARACCTCSPCLNKAGSCFFMYIELCWTIQVFPAFWKFVCCHFALMKDLH